MKKKVFLLFLSMEIVTVSIMGCGNKSGGNSETPAVTAQESVETKDEQAEIDYNDPLLQGMKGEQDTNRYEKLVEYEYQQELNVLDDQYRNFYEIFVASYYDSDGDGMGDLNGVTQKLDYLNDGDDTTDTDLGINGIWFMPIMPSDTYHKYDVKDYYAIDEAYGTMDDFKLLLEECHKRDIHVIIDLVMNHTSSKHPWFTSACEYLEGLADGEEPDLSECPYVDYYFFTYSDHAPSSTFYKVGNSNWYYEGKFWSEMPDLNLYNKDVRREFEEITAYWMDLGVDGFRLDAVKEYVSGSIPSNVEILNWFTAYVHEYKEDAYIVGEVWEDLSTLTQYYAGGLDSAFNFSCAENDGMLAKAAKGNYTMTTFGETMIRIDDQITSYNSDGIDAPFTANHDTARLSNALVHNEDQMKMAAGLMFTMNGTPFVYYGEEIGMSSKGSKDENKRLPFIWSETDLTGMTNPPKEADTGITSYFGSLEEQMEDPLSLYNYYKRGIRLRNENPEIARGKVEIIDLSLPDTALAITKTYEGSCIGIVYNNGEEAIEISLKDSQLSGMQIRGYLTVDGSAVTLEADTITLPAKGIVIIK